MRFLTDEHQQKGLLFLKCPYRIRDIYQSFYTYLFSLLKEKLEDEKKFEKISVNPDTQT